MTTENHYQLLGSSGTAGDIHYVLSRKLRGHFPAGTHFLELSAPYPCKFDARIIMTLDGVQYQDTVSVVITPGVPVAHPIAHIANLIGGKSSKSAGIQYTISALAIHLDCSYSRPSSD